MKRGSSTVEMLVWIAVIVLVIFLSIKLLGRVWAPSAQAINASNASNLLPSP
jgi:hypothetical protein